jgi:Na+/alanine symporter
MHKNLAPLKHQLKESIATAANVVLGARIHYFVYTSICKLMYIGTQCASYILCSNGTSLLSFLNKFGYIAISPKNKGLIGI